MARVLVRCDVRVPSPATLKKYGLTVGEWMTLYNRYGGRCHICKREQSPEAKRAFHTDHEHISGWSKMPPDERKKFVRGILCFTCNKFRMTKGTTLETARGMVEYLEEYESKRTALHHKDFPTK